QRPTPPHLNEYVTCLTVRHAATRAATRFTKSVSSHITPEARRYNRWKAGLALNPSGEHSRTKLKRSVRASDRLAMLLNKRNLSMPRKSTKKATTKKASAKKATATKTAKKAPKNVEKKASA